VWRVPLPPTELARQDSAKKRRQKEVTDSDQTLASAGPDAAGRVWSVAVVNSVGCLGFALARPVKHPMEQRGEQGRSDAMVRPVSCDRTRSIDKNPL
jgi:hypothetical protein